MSYDQKGMPQAFIDWAAVDKILWKVFFRRALVRFMETFIKLAGHR